MIDIRLDEDQALIQETVRSFALEQIRPAAREAEESASIPQGLVAQAWELGLVQAAVPEEYGGQGRSSAVTGAVIAESMAEGDLAFALHALSPRLVIDPVLHLGSQEQKAQVLRTYCGKTFVPGSAATMEPSWNFAFNRMETTASKRGGEWVLQGQKCFVPLAADAPWMVVYARDEQGTTAAFLVAQGTPGVEIGEREKNMGVNALETYEVKLSECRLPAAARLGADATAMLRRARVAQSAMAVGVAKAALDYSINYAKEREAFGVKIAQKQAIAFMLAEMAIEIDATRLLCWEAAWKLDRGEDATREACLAKQYAANMVLAVTDHAVQILGGHGYIREHPVERWLRNGRGFAAFEGLVMV